MGSTVFARVYGGGGTYTHVVQGYLMQLCLLFAINVQLSNVLDGLRVTEQLSWSILFWKTTAVQGPTVKLRQKVLSPWLLVGWGEERVPVPERPAKDAKNPLCAGKCPRYHTEKLHTLFHMHF